MDEVDGLYRGRSTGWVGNCSLRGTWGSLAVACSAESALKIYEFGVSVVMGRRFESQARYFPMLYRSGRLAWDFPIPDHWDFDCFCRRVGICWVEEKSFARTHARNYTCGIRSDINGEIGFPKICSICNGRYGLLMVCCFSGNHMWSRKQRCVKDAALRSLTAHSGNEKDAKNGIERVGVECCWLGGGRLWYLITRWIQRSWFTQKGAFRTFPYLTIDVLWH